jgi:hypothetical protein
MKAATFEVLLLKVLLDSTFREVRMEWEIFSSSSVKFEYRLCNQSNASFHA